MSDQNQESGLLLEDGGMLLTEDGHWLYLGGDPDPDPDPEPDPDRVLVPVLDDFYISPIAAGGICNPDQLTLIELDHSWMGVGRISIDGQAAINATLKLTPTIESKPVASTILGKRPTQWAWRIRGWSIQLQTSDLTQQVMGLSAAGGGPVCLQADLENDAASQLLKMRLSATVVIPPADELAVLSGSGYKQVTLLGQVVDVPKIEMELKND